MTHSHHSETSLKFQEQVVPVISQTQQMLRLVVKIKAYLSPASHDIVRSPSGFCSLNFSSFFLLSFPVIQPLFLPSAPPVVFVPPLSVLSSFLLSTSPLFSSAFFFHLLLLFLFCLVLFFLFLLLLSFVCLSSSSFSSSVLRLFSGDLMTLLLLCLHLVSVYTFKLDHSLLLLHLCVKVFLPSF